jgi:hypothetical protein
MGASKQARKSKPALLGVAYWGNWSAMRGSRILTSSFIGLPMKK